MKLTEETDEDPEGPGEGVKAVFEHEGTGDTTCIKRGNEGRQEEGGTPRNEDVPEPPMSIAKPKPKSTEGRP